MLSFQNNSKNSTFEQHLFDSGHAISSSDSIMQILHITNKTSHMNTHEEYNTYKYMDINKGNKLNDKYIKYR